MNARSHFIGVKERRPEKKESSRTDMAKRKANKFMGLSLAKYTERNTDIHIGGANSQKVEKVTRFQDNAELMKWNMNTNVDIADIDMDIETMHTADITAHVVTASVIAE